MYVPYTDLPPQARVWIYQAVRNLTKNEQEIILQHLHAFTQQWEVHGQPMEASVEIRYHRFVILAANDKASGCSIDSSVRALKEAGDLTGVDFFNRQEVCFKAGDDIFSLPLSGLKEAFANGTIKTSVYLFNNLVDTKQAVEDNWIQEVGNSWVKRYFPQTPVV